MRSLNFITPNFIPGENKYEMNTQKTYIRRPGPYIGRQFSCAIFGFGFCGHISQITLNFLKLYCGTDIFLYVPPIFRIQRF